MTTPARQQPPPPGQGQQDAGLAMTAVTVLAGAATVAEAMAVLGPVWAAMKIRRAALRAALAVVMDRPPDRAGFHGPATAQVARLNLMRRSQFLVASSRRFNDQLARVASGAADPRSVFAMMADERRYYGQHQEACWARMQAAARVDTAVMDHGLLLGWYTVRDSRTSPECRAADHRNFRADAMPAIGYPGAVHPACRCLPGPPVPGAAMVGGRARHRAAAYA